MRIKRSPTSVSPFFIAILALVGIAARAQVDRLVVPESLETVDGNSANGLPFHLFAFPSEELRYQQVYSASDFAALPGPLLITHIEFRPNGTGPGGTGGPFSRILPAIQIELSTTSRDVDDLSLTFAENIGPDRTPVHGGGALPLSSAWLGPDEGPKEFDISIQLETQFTFDASQGNLLMEVFTFSNELTTFFDADSRDTDATSRLISTDAFGATAELFDSFGLVTRFVVVPNGIFVDGFELGDRSAWSAGVP